MDIRQLKQKLLVRSRQFGPALVIAVLSGTAGLYTLGQSGAATYAANQEAEDGVISDTSMVTPDATASGGQSVRFQAPVSPPAPGWTLRWQDAPARGLNNFEAVEDDRADSHPGVTHIFAADGGYRFEMHAAIDRDGSDRQRQEVLGLKNADGSLVAIEKGSIWRQVYDVYLPPTYNGTTNFTHINQIKQISLRNNQDAGSPSSPVATLSLAVSGGNSVMEVITHYPSPVAFNPIQLALLQAKWITIELEYKMDFAANGGYVRMKVTDGSTVVTDNTKPNVDIWVNAGSGDINRMRPKWGIYRSVDSAGLQDTYMLIKNMRWYQKQ